MIIPVLYWWPPTERLRFTKTVPGICDVTSHTGVARKWRNQLSTTFGLETLEESPEEDATALLTTYDALDTFLTAIFL